MFRSIPTSTREMLHWGMISYKQFKSVERLSFDEAKHIIETKQGYQSWSFGAVHIMEYIKTHNVDVGSFTRNGWVGHCLKLAKGRMGPNQPLIVYDRIVQMPKRDIDETSVQWEK